MGFTVVPYTGERDWLELRRSVVTATGMAKIKSGSEASFNSLWKEKHEPPRFHGNRFTQHGKLREPVIASVLESRYPGLKPNQCLVVSDENSRLAATPDMLGDGLFGIGEIKTRRITDDKSEWSSWSDVLADTQGRKYSYQFFWQMFITGADRGVFAVEHWSDEDGWADLRPLRVFEVERDEDMIAELKAVALRFLDWMPPDLRTGDSADFETQAAAQLLGEAEAEAARLRAELRLADEMVKAARADLLALVGDSPSRTEFPNAVVEVAPGRRTNSFDRKALAADYPELDEKYTIKKDGAPSVKVTLKEDE